MVNFEFPPIGGGGGKANLRILEELSSHTNLEIDLLTSASEPGLFEESLSKNIRIIRVGVHKKDLHRWTKLETIEWLWRANKIYKLMIKRNHYDLVHAFFGFPSGLLPYLTRKKRPYIISLRGSDVPGANPRFSLDYVLLAPLFKSIWRSASCLTACSNGLKDRALRFLPNCKIDVTPNGIDLSKFYPENGKNNGTTKLITTGRLSQSKRVELLIEALSILKSQAKLSIVGGGAMEAKLRKLVAKLQLEDRVEFLGRIEPAKMPKLYRDNNIYLCASETEGMSNSMLEAMASGLPIVTTQCEGVEELIVGNGIITGETPKEIAKSIDSLLNNPSKTQEMSQAGIELSKKFTWKETGDKYLRLYEITKNSC